LNQQRIIRHGDLRKLSQPCPGELKPFGSKAGDGTEFKNNIWGSEIGCDVSSEQVNTEEIEEEAIADKSTETGG
jgi:hypothetical protein